MRHIEDDRLLTAVSYRPDVKSIAVVFEDGQRIEATLEALKMPTKKIENICLDEFQRGVEVHFMDGSMLDVSADYFVWLTDAGFQAEYPSDDELPTRVGKAIARLRSLRGMSQVELAGTLEMAPSNLSRLEAGRHMPTLDVLLRVAKALEVPLARLLA